MKNFILCLVACCTFLLCSMDVSAATYNFEVKYGEPSTGDTQGYINILTKNIETGNVSVQTWFWEVANVYGSSWMEVYFNDNKITFTPLGESGDSGTDSCGAFMLAVHYASGKFNVARTGLTNVDSYTYTIGDQSSIYACIPRGNCRTRNAPQVNDVINVMYGSDTYTYQVLQDILDIISQDSNLLNTYIPKLNNIEFGVVQMYQILQDIKADIETYYPQMLDELVWIGAKLQAIEDYLFNQTSSDKNVMDSFEDDSSSQSGALNDLNQNTQVEKPDIDDMSNKVDANLNMDIDANYGLLLSAFTSNNRILTMLLIVASVSLISYVFFGKR